MAIRTSFIVGFPGETGAGFRELCEFVQAAQFDRLGVFTYSDEDTSASYQLDGKVDARTIYNRKRRLMAMQRKISQQAQPRAGRARVVRCWWKARRRRADLLWQARMATQAPEIDGVCYINDSGRRSRCARARSAACASPKPTTTIWWRIGAMLRRFPVPAQGTDSRLLAALIAR